jgi:HK97 family phage major capsid protein
MKNKLELYAEKKDVFAQMSDLNKRAANENRDLNADEKVQFDKLDARMDEVIASIERQTKFEARAKAEAANEFEAKQNQISPAKKENRTEVYSKMLRFGEKSLTREELKVLETRGTDTQITTTDALGGYTVPEGFGNEIIKSLSHYSGVLEAARIIRTNSGNPLPYPTSDQTAVKGKRIGEGVAQAVLDVTFGTKVLNSYIYTSDIIKWSYALAQDSAFDVASETNMIAAERLGRILNEELTTGDGSSKPNGVVTAASAGHTAAATNAITSAEILDLIYSVDRNYRVNGSLMLNDATVKAIRQLEIGSADSRPLWQPSLRDGEPDTIHGYRYYVNNDMDNLASGVSSDVVLFGDFSKYIVRMSQDFTLKPLFERFADEMVVAYFMYCRADGELMDAAAIKKLTLAAS